MFKNIIKVLKNARDRFQAFLDSRINLTATLWIITVASFGLLYRIYPINSIGEILTVLFFFGIGIEVYWVGIFISRVYLKLKNRRNKSVQS